MKRNGLLLVAIWLMLGFMFAHDAQANELCTMYVHVCEGTYLKGRREPSLNSPVLMRMDRGFEVEVIGIANGWAEIVGGEAGTAWCCVEYLADYPPEEDAPMYTVESNGRVRVRDTPDGKTVCYVQNGDVVAVQFVFDGWAFIGDGYVMTSYLILKQ